MVKNRVASLVIHLRGNLDLEPGRRTRVLKWDRPGQVRKELCSIEIFYIFKVFEQKHNVQPNEILHHTQRERNVHIAYI